MAVPPLADFWLPLLRRLADEREHTAHELAHVLADELGLSDEDRADRTSSGKTRVLDRVQWTITYFRQAHVIESPRRGVVKIAERGRVLVSRNLEAGESLGLDGLAPLQLVVGNAAATRVSYKGKPVDLEPRARDNVARFELK